MTTDTLEKKKTFKTMNENGTCYSFKMHSEATTNDAMKYARLWNSLAGDTAKIVKVWEIDV